MQIFKKSQFWILINIYLCGKPEYEFFNLLNKNFVGFDYIDN